MVTSALSSRRVVVRSLDISPVTEYPCVEAMFVSSVMVTILGRLYTNGCRLTLHAAVCHERPGFHLCEYYCSELCSLRG